MYKVEVWKSDPERHHALFLYETFDTEKGYTKQDCKDNAEKMIINLKNSHECHLQIVEIEQRIIYGYDYKTEKEFK